MHYLCVCWRCPPPSGLWVVVWEEYGADLGPRHTNWHCRQFSVSGQNPGWFSASRGKSWLVLSICRKSWLNPPKISACGGLVLSIWAEFWPILSIWAQNLAGSQFSVRMPGAHPTARRHRTCPKPETRNRPLGLRERQCRKNAQRVVFQLGD